MMVHFHKAFPYAGLGVFSSFWKPPPHHRNSHHSSVAAISTPGDYGFVRGAFPGATPGQSTTWKAIRSYGNACMHDAALAEDATLKRLGITAAVPEQSGYQDQVCMQVVMTAGATRDFKSWDAFLAARSRSLPYFQTYAAAVSAEEQSVESDVETDTLEEQITARIIPDQMWRLPMTGTLKKRASLDAETDRAVDGRFALAAINVDWDNSRWSRHVLETRGGPAVLKEGRKPAHMMWLLVQHGDVDPTFQVTTLRQLGKLSRAGQFPKPDYALLDDCVMIAITGKQHYGSQISCQNHRFAPVSMDAGGDDSKTLDARRAEMELESEADYLKRFPAHC